MKSFFSSLLFSILFIQATGQQPFLLVGTYDSPKSEGVYVFRFNSNTGTAEVVSHIKTSNPSYISISPDKNFVYAVHENGNNGKGGEVAAFSFNRVTGQLRFINQQPTGGDHPCYVEVDHTGRWVFAANYTSGSFSVFPVDEKGGLGAVSSHIQHTGSGKNKERQAGPHVHCTKISPDNKWLFVPDLGIDKVMIYSFNDKTGELKPSKQQYVKTEPGAGPRHFIFHPDNKFAYLIEEMGGMVDVYKYKKGKLKLKQRISTMPPADNRFPGSADIHISADGKFLYASNRGTVNNIVIYGINPANGKLTLAGFQSTMGNSPRNFNIDPSGDFLLAGNQNSDAIVIFKRDNATGLLFDSGKRISIGKPVCIKWITTDE